MIDPASRFILMSVCGALLAGCSDSAVTPQPSRVKPTAIRIQRPAQEPLNFSRRYLDSKGSPEPGFLLRGRQRTYWFPAESRWSKVDDQLLVVAYNNLFVFPRGAVAARDNERSKTLDLEGVAPERSDVLASYAREHVKQRSLTRAPQVVGGSSCDVSDAACACPDCTVDPFDGNVLTLTVFGGSGAHGAPINAYFSCAIASPPDYANNDFTAYQACLASTGFGPGDFFFNQLRQNCRDYAWYTFNAVTVFDTQANPIQKGAITYTWSHLSLLQNPISASGSLALNSATDPYLEFYSYPTLDFGFSSERYAFYGPGETGFVYGAYARLARTVNSFYPLGS